MYRANLASFGKTESMATRVWKSSRVDYYRELVGVDFFGG
jgi:hypothetical protein